MKQCERGHFFDDTRYQECPYCDTVQPTYGATVSVKSVIETPAPTSSEDTPVLDNALTTTSDAALVDTDAALDTDAGSDATPDGAPTETDATPISPAPSLDAIFIASAPSLEITPAAPAATFAATLAPTPAAPLTPTTAPQDIGATVGVFSHVGIDPPVAFVIVIDGPDKGAFFALRAGRNFIGRGSGSDVELSSDEAISREGHALISYDARKNSFLIASGSSRQITYLNGEELTDARPIAAYDVIELGRSKLSFLPFCGERFEWGTQ
jgi:hypothetical protein